MVKKGSSRVPRALLPVPPESRRPHRRLLDLQAPPPALVLAALFLPSSLVPKAIGGARSSCLGTRRGSSPAASSLAWMTSSCQVHMLVLILLLGSPSCS